MLAIKVKNLIVQLILTVISFGINVIVILPVWLIISGEWEELLTETNGLIMLPLMFVICWGGGFALNRLLFWIKGKKVDETYPVWKEKYLYTDETHEFKRKPYSDEEYEVITITDHYTTCIDYEKELTGWGWLATFLAFIAFPMRLVSLVMAFVAMFNHRVFVTHRRLNSDMPVTKSSAFTHSLFDFVIMRASLCKTEGTRSKKSIPFIILYVALFVILNLLALEFLGRNRFDWAEDWSTEVSLLLGVVVLLTDLILLIKHSVLLGKAYTKKKALITMVKIIIPPLIWMIYNLVFFNAFG